MPSLRDIKRRITSVKSTQKITRAMKMVASARLRRAQQAIVQARPYAYHMRDLANRLALRVAGESHPLLRRGDSNKVGLIVVTADRGLCGGFNTNIVNETLRVIRDELKGHEVELTVVGRKGVDVLRRRPVTIGKTHMNLDDMSPLRAADTIINDVVAGFMEGHTDTVYCLYNEFKSAISQRVVLEKILPFEPEEPGEIVIDYLYEPDAPEVVKALLTQHMQIQMHRILLESSASEHGARMTAMEAATNNAGEVIDKLTLKYNRARQDAITTEMIEIVSGAEAL